MPIDPQSVAAAQDRLAGIHARARAKKGVAIAAEAPTLTKVVEKCPLCKQPGSFIRTRYFDGGVTGDVWMCQNANCKSYRLYWTTGDTCKTIGKRVRQGEKKPNKWEAAYFAKLVSDGQCVRLREQSLRFRLANGSWYKSDITGCRAGVQTAWEIKGGKNMKGHAKGMLTLKFAATIWTDWRFILVTRDNGVWREQEMLP